MKMIVIKANNFLAAVVNVLLLIGLFMYAATGMDSVILSILLPSLVHITLCGSLLYFLYYEPDTKHEIANR